MSDFFQTTNRREAMKYFYIQPEVAGGLGKNTVMDRSVHPPIVSRLHHEFKS
jgi:hypothetical protein